MRAIRFSEFGVPADVLRLEDVPLPAPGPGEVRLRMTHRPINPSDVLTVMGVYPIRSPLPFTPGLEGVGRVDATGSGVTALARGQRVVTLAGTPGTWAEYLVIPADRVLPVPDTLDDGVAAQLLVNPVTAYALLTDELPLAEGDWLLQTAASSALGRMIVELAHARGIRTVNVVRSRVHVDALLALGADAVVVSEEANAEALVERIMAHTGGQGVRAAVDAVGGALGGHVARCLAPGGTLLAIGLLGNDLVMPLASGELLFKGASVRGFWLPLWFARQTPASVGQALHAVVNALGEGRLHAPVAAEYDLADINVALREVERVGRAGKILLRG